MGVGSTLLASSIAERKSIGIDISENILKYKAANKYLNLTSNIP